jgi:hypothetical protein
MWLFFSAALVVVGAAITFLLRRYAAPSVPLVVMAATTYAWLVALIVVVRASLPSSLNAPAFSKGARPAVEGAWWLTGGRGRGPTYANCPTTAPVPCIPPLGGGCPEPQPRPRPKPQP